MTEDRELHEIFVEAMSSLASGVAVITARKPDGQPCGLAATSVTSYSAHPPSVLASISHASRCHEALAGCERFGVHILRADESELARVFAGKGDDKFAGVDWAWDDDVPELRGTLAYLRCRRADASASTTTRSWSGTSSAAAWRRASRCSTRAGGWTGCCASKPSQSRSLAAGGTETGQNSAP